MSILHKWDGPVYWAASHPSILMQEKIVNGFLTVCSCLLMSGCSRLLLLICVVHREKLDSSVMFEEQLEMSSKDNATLVTNDFTDH